MDDPEPAELGLFGQSGFGFLVNGYGDPAE
jgi:hypothetical protein